jgi:mono/diheme cytochrome c family protein
MRNMVFGAVSALVLVPLAFLAYAALGFVSVNADAAPPALETAIMQRALHASVRRSAARDSALPAATDSLVIAGGRRYLNDCVGCHGAPGEKPSEFGASFYPPAPQYTTTGTKYSPDELWWIARHGIFMTGMDSKAHDYKPTSLASIVAFIAAAKTLPPALLDSIHAKPKK